MIPAFSLAISSIVLPRIEVWSSDIPVMTDKTDVLIIGGGITGLTAAYFLKDSDKKVTLIDKSIIAGGITSKTTAKINYLQGTIYQDLESSFNNILLICSKNGIAEAFWLVSISISK